MSAPMRKRLSPEEMKAMAVPAATKGTGKGSGSMMVPVPKQGKAVSAMAPPPAWDTQLWRC